jgi:arabinose-5-phosphate isomerase
MTGTISLAKKVVAIEIQALQAMTERIDQEFENAVEIVLVSKGRVVVVGMGKSGLIGKKIAATLASTGTAAFSVHPAEAFHGDLGMIQPSDVLLMISNSGETEELVRLLPFLAHQKNPIIAMTGKSDSVLGRHANAVLDVSVAREACNNNLAPTSSTTAALVIGDALAVVLSEKRNFQPADFARFHPGGNLGRRLLTRVADMMHTENLPICLKEDSFKDVVHAITRGRLGLILIMEGDELCGLITDGDVRRTFDSDLDYKRIQAKHIMTVDPQSIFPEEQFVNAEAQIRTKKINALVVKDASGKVRGVLQIQDLITDEPAR